MTVVLNQGHASPGGINQFPGWREPSPALQHMKFLNEKVFHPIYSFKVRGAWKTVQLLKGGVVEKRFLFLLILLF